MEGALLGPESSPEAFLDQGQKGRFVLNRKGEAILFDRTAAVLMGLDPVDALGGRLNLDRPDAPLFKQEGETSEAVLIRVRDARPYREVQSALCAIEGQARSFTEQAERSRSTVEQLRRLLEVAESDPEPRGFLGAVSLVARKLSPAGGSLTTPYTTETWGDQTGLKGTRQLGPGVVFQHADLDAEPQPAPIDVLTSIVSIGLRT